MEYTLDNQSLTISNSLTLICTCDSMVPFEEMFLHRDSSYPKSISQIFHINNLVLTWAVFIADQPKMAKNIKGSSVILVLNFLQSSAMILYLSGPLDLSYTPSTKMSLYTSKNLFDSILSVMEFISGTGKIQ